MVVAWGPVEFSGTETLGIFVFAGIIPPLVVAIAGSLVHAAVLAFAKQEGVTVGPLFLRWWGACTGIWIGGLLLAAVLA